MKSDWFVVLASRFLWKQVHAPKQQHDISSYRINTAFESATVFRRFVELFALKYRQ